MFGNSGRRHFLVNSGSGMLHIELQGRWFAPYSNEQQRENGVSVNKSDFSQKTVSPAMLSYIFHSERLFVPKNDFFTQIWRSGSTCLKSNFTSY